ncbi:RNA-directed DNA polymerase, eukaryota, reverse transcriptase zinc-binding domain protein, partial [Tanacetum coccineum]
SHVATSNLQKLCTSVFSHWDWASKLKREKKEVFCSFIYAHNGYIQRRELWKSLSLHKVFVCNRPWCLLGDFNATLYLEESTTGSSRIDIAMRDFKACVDDIEVLDVQNVTPPKI